MRRVVLVALAVFAVGLAALLLIDRATRDVQPLPEPVTPGPSPEAGVGEPVVVPDDEGQTTEVATSGFVRLIDYDPDTRARRYEARAQDHRTLEVGAIDAQGVEVDAYDESGERMVSSLRAARGLLRVVVEDGRPRLAEDQPITLQEVHARFEEGLEFTPLELEVPVLEGLLGERTLRSAEPVQLTGVGLSARGTGLFVDGRAELLRLERDPVVELVLPQGGRATLAAPGALTLANRPDLGPELASVEAVGGALLTLSGEVPLQVEAPVVRLIGRVLRDPDRFVPLRAEAEGGVELRPEQGRFLGERAEVDFGPDGLPQSGLLLGSPRIETDLHGVDLSGLGREAPQVPGETLPVVGEGHSELALTFGTRSTFALDGPATVDLPTLGATLASRGPITGVREEPGGYATVEAVGGVEVESPDARLEAEALELEALPASDGEEVFARLTTRGPTLASGSLEEGRRGYEMLARGGLVYVRKGEEFEVPRATDVELEVTGEGAFRARADQLRDLVGSTLSFVASGDVEVEDERGRGRGERLVAHGREHAELFGAAGEPATLTLPEGELAAGHIEARGERLSAQGDVHASLQIGELQADLRSRWLDLGPGDPAGTEQGAADWALDAGGDVHAVVITPEARQELTSKLLRLEADEEQPAGGGSARLAPAGLTAVGDVVASYQGEFRLNGRGERLTVDRRRVARLEPAPGERVALDGEMPAEAVNFAMTAASVEYGLDRILAERPDLEVQGLDLPLIGESVEDDRSRLRAVAGWLVVDRRSLLFSDGVYIGRVSALSEGWSLDADRVLIAAAGGPKAPAAQGDAGLPSLEELPVGGELDELYAWGGFVASAAGGLQVRGEQLRVSRSEDRITVEGTPAVVTGRGVSWRSNWFELDGTTRSIQAAQGEMRTTAPGGGAWVLRYASLEPVETADTTIQVLREPVLIGESGELRASWAVFWVDPRRWRTLSSGSQVPEDEAATGELRARPRKRSLFGELDNLREVDWLREVYLEGNVVYSIEGENRARAEAVYLDLVDGHGWVRKVDIQTLMPYTSRRLPMKVSADWLRHSADGTYRADSAVATTCEHEKPHYVIEIGELSVVPRTSRRSRLDPQTGELAEVEVFEGWDVVARDNHLRVWRGLGLPLPKVEFPLDDKYRVETEEVSVFGMRPLSLGSDAKFGTYVGTSFALDLTWLAELFDRLIGGSGDVDGADGPGGRAGKADLDARWLEGRGGLLLGIEIPFYSPGRYWLDFMADGIYDNGEDRGLVRVPVDDRDPFRRWFRTRGRYLFGQREWLDLVATYQSDAGFQAEYFESDYLQFEERETYLHYRKADGDNAVSATLEAPPQEFHTEIVEQPALRLFDGRAQIASLGSLPLYYGSDSSAGQYLRREGSGGYEDPFPDGLGERDVLRFDTDHRLELPVDLSLAGLRATPYVEGRFTAWDEGADPDESPARVGLLAGAELATTLFRTFSGGSRHAVTPSLAVRTDLATHGDDTALVPIDATELPLQGTYTDMAVRSRWSHAERPDALDLELGITYANDVQAPLPEGWLPLRMRGVWFSTMLGIPYVVSYDGRYDVDDAETVYSRGRLGFEPLPSVDVELGHTFGRDSLTSVALFDAVTLGARWRISPKWEVEGGQTISNQGDGRLASRFLLRRLGHDFVFEFETRFIAGEGQSWGFKIDPLLLWRKKGFSVLDNARSQGQ